MLSLEEKFGSACDYVEKNYSKLKPDILMRLYGCYKQATVGTCNVPKPSFFDFSGHAKWKAWSKLKFESKKDAMKLYIETLDEAVPNWSSEGNTNDSNWVSVSTMCRETELAESSKNAFDWVKEDNLDRLKQCGKLSTSQRDEQGLSLLHWAADRGYVDIVKYLIEVAKIDINCRDNEQQTPLHYAAACGHTETCRLLIQLGADTKVRDNEGNSPKDLADVPTVIELFT